MAIDRDQIKTEDRGTASKSSKTYEDMENAANKERKQTTASPAEVKERNRQQRTQGRKGCKTARIALAISDENLAYLRIMGKKMGMTNAQFIGYIMREHRKDHAEMYADAINEVNALVAEAQKARAENELERIKQEEQMDAARKAAEEALDSLKGNEGK